MISHIRYAWKAKLSCIAENRGKLFSAIMRISLKFLNKLRFSCNISSDNNLGWFI